MSEEFPTPLDLHVTSVDGATYPLEKKLVKSLLMARERIVSCMNKHGRFMPTAQIVTIAFIDEALTEVKDKWHYNFDEFKEEIKVQIKQEMGL